MPGSQCSCSGLIFLLFGCGVGCPQRVAASFEGLVAHTVGVVDVAENVVRVAVVMIIKFGSI